MFRLMGQFLQSIFQSSASFENHMKQMRLQNRLTIEEVAKHTGYSISMIFKIEEGRAIPSPEKAYLFRRLYRTTFDKIYLPFFE